MSITLVIPNRNRNLDTVSRTLASVATQLSDTVQAVVVDYGSESQYQLQLEEVVTKHGMRFISCPTQGQLWHKTRAINMVLRACDSEYFMVLDMDCIVHPEFVQKAITLAGTDKCIYFPYGFLTAAESQKNQAFDQYAIDFIGGLTGTAIFKTEALKAINGYDEYFHNWGAEDADVLERMKRVGHEVVFHEGEALLLHQRHAKFYRSKTSTAPYHSYLEKINHSYFTLSRKRNKIKANLNTPWGTPCDTVEYKKLNTPDIKLDLHCTADEVAGLITHLAEPQESKVLEISITPHPQERSLKNRVKKVLGKKTPLFMAMEDANDRIIEQLISAHRNRPYSYAYDRVKEEIILTINLG